MSAIFSLNGVGFRYPNASGLALEATDLEINAGEWVVLLGSNGSGKSTLLKILNALLLPTQGFYCFQGTKAEKDNIYLIREKVSLVFQNPEDMITASIVEEDAAFAPENLCLPPSEIRKRVDEALTAVGLYERAEDSVDSLSGGQKQRLAIAGALAAHPEALLFDEASSMLDPNGSAAFTQILRSLHSEGKTIVQTTHKLSEISGSDRVIVLDNGKIEWDGKTDNFMSLGSGKLESFGLTLPNEYILQKILADNNIIPKLTEPTAEAMAEEILK